MIKQLILLLSYILTLNANNYQLEHIPTPTNISKEIGALATLPSGKLVVAFHSGEIAFYSHKEKKWQLYAQGLHEVLGLIAHSKSHITVVQRPEVTNLIDTDNDGRANYYQTLTDQFGLSGNYHEFNFSANTTDKDGNYYIGLNVASNMSSIWKQIRGPWSNIGLPRKEFYQKWDKSRKEKAGRMFARVAYRGWILKVSPKGKITPWASGFRSPNGIGIDDKDNVLVTDNQGDWIGTSPLYHVKKGKFYGHPASLIWEENWTKDNPLHLNPKVLDAMRTKPTAIFPHGEYASSPTQPLFIKDNRLGPFKGQWLIGDMNTHHILRFMPDWINGIMQGAILIHFDDSKIGRGNNRFSWGNDNDLWVGKVHLKWAGDKGIKRIKFSKLTKTMIQSVKLIDDQTFQITFTKQLSKRPKKEQINIQKFNYHYWVKYGSPKTKQQAIKIEMINYRDKKLLIKVPYLQEEFNYEFKFSLPELANKKFVYTLNKLYNSDNKSKLEPLKKSPKILKWYTENKLSDNSSNKGWVYLFDGTRKSALENFSYQAEKWIVKNKTLTIKRRKGMGSLYTKQSFKDFILEVDFKFNSPNTNSGIFYFSKKGKHFEYQLCDTKFSQHKAPLHRTGAIYDIIANPFGYLLKKNGWNKALIVSQNGTLSHYLNEKLLFSINMTNPKFQKAYQKSKYFKESPQFNQEGKIGFQDHNDSDVSFRNIRIKEL